MRTSDLAWTVAILLAAPTAGQSPGPPELLRTDSRSPYVHRLTLYDEDGAVIDPSEEHAAPYSARATCARCHEYGSISRGWHFNAGAPDVDAGRPGEPWIYVEPATGTQIPLSLRRWPGTWLPQEIGLSDWEFVLRFGRHMPGWVESGRRALSGTAQDPKHTARAAAAPDRREIAGRLDIDCLLCHSADMTHDPAERARQIERQNFRWSATAAAGLGVVRGEARRLPDDWDPLAPRNPDRPDLWPPSIVYDRSRFDADDRVLFDISRRPPAERCYYCHTVRQVGPGSPRAFEEAGDVHLAAGLTCTDCHRNGIDHAIVRGFEGEVSTNPLAPALTCRGCHMGEVSARDVPGQLGGRLRAPRPLHLGIPPVHFERMTCTACHSGPWPQDAASRFQTALAHALGTASKERSEADPPLIVGPIFGRDPDGRIAPQRAVWPAFWGVRDADGGVRPLALDVVARAFGHEPAADRQIRSDDRGGRRRAENAAGGSEPAAPLSDAKIVAVLAELAKFVEGEPVYVSGGLLHRLSSQGALTKAEDAVAEPYRWSLAHDVRPAAQSLGARGCTDCHATDAAIFFGRAGPQPDDEPMAFAPLRSAPMHEVHGYPGRLAGAWGYLFGVRPAFKALGLTCVALTALVLLHYGWAGLAAILRRMSS